MSKKNSREEKYRRKLEKEERKSSGTVTTTKRQMWVNVKDRYGRTVQKPVMMPVLKGRS